MLPEYYNFNGENYIIFIGKNKYDNFNIIDESIDTDIWFHIDGEPSCHVILKNTLKIKNIPKIVIKRCAYLCKINFVIYTQIINVTKTNIIGQVYAVNCKTISI